MDKHTLYRKPIGRRIILIVSYVIVLGMIIGGRLGLISVDRINEKYEPVSAKIEEIRIERVKSRQTKKIKNEYHVTVSYQVEETIYCSSLNYYNSSWKTGDTILIHYNPENPNQFSFIKGRKLLCKLFIAVGLITLVLLWGLTKLINKISS